MIPFIRVGEDTTRPTRAGSGQRRRDNGAWRALQPGSRRTSPATSSSTRPASTARPAARSRPRSSRSRRATSSFVQRQPATEAGARRAPDGAGLVSHRLHRHRASERTLRPRSPRFPEPLDERRLLLRLHRGVVVRRVQLPDPAPGGQRARGLPARGRAARCGGSRRWAACAGCSSPIATTWPTTPRFRRRFGCERILHARRRRRAARRSRAAARRATSPWPLAAGPPVIPVPGPHPRQRRAALPRAVPLHRRPPRWDAETAAGSTPRAASAGTRGPSRSARWSGCSTSASSGCCPATAGASAPRRRRR